MVSVKKSLIYLEILLSIDGIICQESKSISYQALLSPVLAFKNNYRPPHLVLTIFLFQI